MNKLRTIGTLLIMAGIFAAVLGGGDGHNNMDGTLWLMIAGMISALLGAGCLVITGDIQ